MTLCRVRRIPCFLLALSAFAQSAPWSSVMRGSWVQTRAATAGDITLAAKDSVSQIVVADDENAAVHQAAEFLAGDIAKISGQKPAIVKTATDDKVNIRLVTLGYGQIPSSVDTRGMEGQGESYRVVTEGRNVWLVGSNPRGTAFASYTLSERIGIDPIYIWSGYQPEHHDPLVLKRTSYSQAPPTFRYRGFFHDDEDLLPRPFDANGYFLQTGDVPLDWYKRFFETAQFARGEYAPFDRWYHESWIRSAQSNNNPHRAFNQLRDFIGNEGHGSLPALPGRGGLGPGPGRGAPDAGPGREVPVR